MAKKVQVELTQDEAKVLVNARPRGVSKAAESALDAAQLKVAKAMLEAKHGR